MLKKIENVLDKTAGKFTPEALAKSEESERLTEPSTFPDEFYTSPGDFIIIPDSGTIYGIEIDEYHTNERGTFAQLDIAVAHGDWGYELDECNIWIGKDGSSVMTDSFDIAENTIKGMTLDEVKERVFNTNARKEANGNAKTAYNAARETFADLETEGISMKQAVEKGYFDEMLSENGLNIGVIADVKSLGGGDRNVCSYFKDNDIGDGTVILRINSYDDRDLFVQYMDETGVIGQYPKPLDSKGADKVQWGTFYE